METELIRNLFQIFITKSLQRPSFLFYQAVPFRAPNVVLYTVHTKIYIDRYADI